MMTTPPATEKTLTHLRLWLFVLAALVLAMVAVGGATRLTHSGLTITEWKPIMGAIPPLTEHDWAEIFSKYQQIPEYRQLNSGMTLDEFKPLFWWEWSHRFLGRFVGLVAGLGLLWFLAKPDIRGRYWKPLVSIFALGGITGAAGWYMVASGLSVRTDVSQYRLTLHLGLATLIIGLTIWTALGVGVRRDVSRLKTWLGLLGLALPVAVYGQILLGGFVAGLDAGLTYNTWPLMDGRLIPQGLRAMTPVWANPFENPVTAQFDHRMGAYAVALLALLNHLWVWRRGDARLMPSAAAVLTVVLAQVALGIWALLAVVPLHLALAHQVLAMAVLATTIWHLHAVVSEPQSQHGSNRQSLLRRMYW